MVQNNPQIKTGLKLFDGVPLRVPIINSNLVEFPHPTFKGFPTYCGAGSGFGDWIVPDRAMGLSLSPACFIHDLCWGLATTWGEFHQSNMIFLENMRSIISHRSHDRFEKFLRYTIAFLYYSVVNNTIGAYIFWKEHR